MILGPIDERLRVLDPETDGEGLGFQQDLLRGEQPIDVTRGMAGGEDHGIGADFASIGGDHSADVVSGDDEIDDLGLEPDLAAGVEDRARGWP